MANNRLFIECVGCEEKDLFSNPDAMCEWFDKHKFCGGTEAHFRLYYECMPNYDVGGIEAILEQKANPTPGTVK